MGQNKQFQFLFVGQSQTVAANLRVLVQNYAPAIFTGKVYSTPPLVEFSAVTSQRQALRIIRGTSLDVILLETGAGNGDRKKFAEVTHKQQPVSRIIELGSERSKAPHPFNHFLKLPLEVQQVVDVLRHCIYPGTTHLLPFGPFVLDSANAILLCPNGEKPLRPMEAKLLGYLIANRGVIVKRVEIMRHVWGTEYIDDTRTLDVHIRQLRKQIEINPSAPEYLITERGLGYVLKA